MKIFRDPIHNVIDLSTGDIAVDTLIANLIDSAEFQRLRYIRQLGFTYLAYPSATHSRFEHSLGVAFLAKRFLEQLLKLRHSITNKSPLLQDFFTEIEKNKHHIIIAALLHDLGHGPLSHVLEDITTNHHEDWTKRIILEKTDVNRLLSTFDKNLPQDICHILFEKNNPKPVAKLISGTIDIDKIDYLLRDSHMTGSGYGKFDMEWLLNVMTVGIVDNKVEIGLDLGKGQSVAEDFIMARVYMFKNVYLHKINTITCRMLKELLHYINALPAQTKDALFPSLALKNVLLGTPTSKEYLQITDIEIFYFLKTLEHNNDTTIKKLASGLLNRNLSKTATDDLVKSIPVDANDIFLFDKNGVGYSLQSVSDIL